MVDRTLPVKIADIGCGTGASTVVLAQRVKGHITAVDVLQDFLDVLERNAENMGLAENISTRCCSMDNLPFGDEEFDVIWSEGAIYNIGFERGIQDWKRYVKVGGLLVVSEITWITAHRPSELQTYWEREYPEIDVASSKIGVLEKNGYAPIGYFVLPEQCWLDNYYRPMQESFQHFLTRNGNTKEARAVVDAERREIEMYEHYKTFYSYGVYIARKLE
jgi:ubiquinone/menaquinone biosynthesis C-methylase UbiE